MQTKTALPQLVHIEQLTWLRGIAAFFVIISHIINATEVAYLPEDEIPEDKTIHVFLMSLFNLGSFGVVIFFVLSGCTLYISNANKFHDKYIISFYIKRFFRIWPPFAASLLIYILFRELFQLYHASPKGYWIEHQFLADFQSQHILSYLTLTFNITGPQELFNNAYWSLPVEFQYYLIFPLMVLLLRTAGITGVIALCIALYFLPSFNLIQYNENTFFRLAYSFGGGVLVGYFYSRFAIRINTKVGLPILAGLILFAASLANKWWSLPDISIFSDVWKWYCFIAIAAVFFCLFSPIHLPERIKGFLLHYGNISYSTYLYHNVLIGLATIIAIQMGIHSAWERILLTSILALLGTYWLASASYRYIETPSIEIGRKLGKKLIRKPV